VSQQAEFKGGFTAFRGPGDLWTGAVVTDFKTRPGAYTLHRDKADPAGVYRVKYGHVHVCSFKADSCAEAMKLLPAVAGDLDAAQRRHTPERYPGENHDVELVQLALRKITAKQATITTVKDGQPEIEPNGIKHVVKAIGTEHFKAVADAALLVYGPEGRTKFNEARRRIKTGNGTEQDKHVEKLWREKLAFDYGDGDPSYRWQLVFLSRFVSLKSDYINQFFNATATFWPWVLCELIEDLKKLKIVEIPSAGTLKNFASKHNLKAPR